MTDEHVSIDPDQIQTPRLVLRAWSPDDAVDAWETYGSKEVTRWLLPVMQRVPDIVVMRELIVEWIADSYSRRFPEGRWAIERRADGAVIGGAELVPWGGSSRLFMGWQLRPSAWGNGFASEIGHALGHQAFELEGTDEIFAMAHPHNRRGVATALRIGMTHAGTTTEVENVELNLYRLRRADLHQLFPGVSPMAGYNPVGLDDW